MGNRETGDERMGNRETGDERMGNRETEDERKWGIRRLRMREDGE